MYNISNEKLPTDFKNSKFVMISDMHNSFYGKNNEKVLNTIKDINPDFIVIAGDMPVANTENETINLKTAQFITDLADISDIYYGFGNHEERMMEKELLKDSWEKYYDVIKTYKGSHNIYCMNNNMLRIYKDKSFINIFGLNLELKFYQRFSNEKLEADEIIEKVGEPDKALYNIIIAHNPDYFESYVGWGADLILSGHVHGGMVRLPFIGGVISPKPRLFPHFDYGKYEKDKSIMLLSNGLGSHSIKLRINNIPEIVVIQFE